LSELRFLLATDADALTRVLGIVYRAISGFVLRKALARGVPSYAFRPSLYRGFKILRSVLVAAAR
jgi:hypothetical protein